MIDKAPPSEAALGEEAHIAPKFNVGSGRQGAGEPQEPLSGRLAESLREAQARLELATAAANIGIWDWDLLANSIVYSDRAKALFGFPLDRPVTLEMVRNATHPDDLPRTSAMGRRARDPLLREKAPYEYRIIRGDGAIRWVIAHGEAVFAMVDGVERAVRYAGTIQDITDRKQAEQSLRDSEARLRLAIDAGRMAVWQVEAGSDAVKGSPELYRLLGFPEGVTPSLDEIRARYYPGDRDRLRAAGAEAVAKGERFFEADFRCVWPDDSIRWLLLRAEIQSGPDGKPTGAFGVLMDITAQKTAEERQRLLLGELNHRVKNTLATIQSIAAQTLRNAVSLPKARAALESRLLALARGHDILTRENWQSASLAAIVDEALLPFVGADASRFSAQGPETRLPPAAALGFTMALQELATNAAKYGAFSVDGGRVGLHWTVAEDETGQRLQASWRESGGPTVVPPKTRGFGSRLIQGVAADLGGTAEFVFHPAGLTCTITARLPKHPRAGETA